MLQYASCLCLISLEPENQWPEIIMYLYRLKVLCAFYSNMHTYGMPGKQEVQLGYRIRNQLGKIPIDVLPPSHL